MMTKEKKEQLIEQASLANKDQNFEVASRIAQQLLAEDTEMGFEKVHIEALLILTETQYLQGMYKDALTYAIQANELLSSNADKELSGLQAKTNNYLGIIYNNLAEYEQALSHYCKALNVFEEQGNKREIAKVSGNIGGLYANSADYIKALQFFVKAQNIYEELGDNIATATITSNIGNIYHELAYYTKSLEYYQKALAIHQESNNKKGIAFTTINIGNLYNTLTEYDLAIQYYEQSLDMFLQIANKWGIARARGNMGSAYRKIMNYTLAFDNLSKSFTEREQLGDNVGLAIITSEIGMLYLDKNFAEFDDKKAKEFLLKSLAMYQDLGTKNEGFEVHKALAHLYKDQGQWEEAFKHFERYITLEKEIHSAEARKQVEKELFDRHLQEREREIAIERVAAAAKFDATQAILHNILPAQIADRIIAGEKVIADHFEHVSVFFCDIVGFTKISQEVSAHELVALLNNIFSEFDRLTRKHGLEKIKTMGDAYMAVAGAPLAQVNHAERAAQFAMEVMQSLQSFRMRTGSNLEVRVGLHSGTAIAGIIGENKFVYDLWGDAVNIASRMESHGEASKIHVSEDFVRELKNSSFLFKERGEIDVKGKGKMKTYFLES